MRVPGLLAGGPARVRTGAKFSAAVGALVLGVLVVAGVGLLGLSRMKSDVDRLAGHNIPAIAAAAELSTAVYAVRETALPQLSTTDPATADRLGAELDRTKIPRLRQALRTLRTLTAEDPGFGPQLDQIQGHLDRYQQLRGTVDRREQDGSTPDRATLAALAERAGPLFDRMTAGAEGIRDGEVAEAESSGQEAVSTHRSTRSLLIAGAAASLAGGLVVMLLLVRQNEAARLLDADQAEFAETLQVTASEDEAHELVQRHLKRSLPDTAAVVLKRNNSENRLEAATALTPDSTMVSRLAGAEPRSCLALRFGRTHREDPSRLSLVSCALCTDPASRSICEPLLVGGQVIGSVLVAHRQPLDADQEARIKNSVSQAAPVLANLRNLALAEFRANNDSLTGLPNKRATDDTLKRMVAQANRSVTPLAALMLDLDHFKQVNDRFGHAKGDEVLAAVGAAVHSSLRAGDFAGRFGGEELLVLLPDTTAEAALVVAEKMRNTIAAISVPGVERGITVSIGVADLIQHGGHASGLLRQADRALYAAKTAGRNRTVVAPIGDGPQAAAGPASDVAAAGPGSDGAAVDGSAGGATAAAAPAGSADPSR